MRAQPALRSASPFRSEPFRSHANVARQSHLCGQSRPDSARLQRPAPPARMQSRVFAGFADSSVHPIRSAPCIYRLYYTRACLRELRRDERMRLGEANAGPDPGQIPLLLAPAMPGARSVSRGCGCLASAAAPDGRARWRQSVHRPDRCESRAGQAGGRPPGQPAKS